MKRFLKVTIFILLLIVAYLIILNQFPKEAGRFPFIVALFIGDLYLWNSFGAWMKRQKVPVKIVLALLYWSPLILLSLVIGTRMVDIELIADERAGLLIQGFIFSAYASKLLPVIFLIISDIVKGVKLIIKFSHKKHETAKEKLPAEVITRSVFLRQIGLVSGGLLFSGLIAGMMKWVHDFKIHRHAISFAGLPQSFNGFRIVQISDLHLGSWSAKGELETAVNRINELSPDVVFFTGDLVNYKTDEAFEFEGVLSKLKAEYGVFATLGNHDYGDYTRWSSPEAKMRNMTDLFDFYRRIGWKLLKNNHAIIEKQGGKIAIIGVENWGAIARFPQYGDIEKAKSGSESANLKILLSHDPSHWEKVISTAHPDINLTLSGHTHGFQFGVETKYLKWSPAQYAYKYWAGLYSNELAGGASQYLYVNRGLGTVGYPGRVGILPEITLVELTS